MWLPVLGLLLGILLGLVSNIHPSEAYTHYLLLAVLAGLDTLFGGMRAYLTGRFDNKICVVGFLFSVFLAESLTFLGEQIGVDLYLAAVFAFGVRLFHNLSGIRHVFFKERAVRDREID